MIWDFGKKVPHYCSRNVIVPVFSSMLSTIARDSRWMPFLRSSSPIAAGLEAFFNYDARTDQGCTGGFYQGSKTLESSSVC